MIKKLSFKISSFKDRTFLLTKGSTFLLYSNPYITVRARKQEPKLANGRYVCIVRKSVASAPIRNYLRRCTREAFRSTKLYTFPYDFIFTFKKKCSYREVETALMHTIQNISEKTDLSQN